MARSGEFAFLMEKRRELMLAEQRGVTGQPSGLYKSRGAAVEAVVGAVYVRHVSCLSDRKSVV